MGAILSLFQIHSYTTRIARRLAAAQALGVEAPNVDPVLSYFRAPPAYRGESAQKLRKAVADAVRQERSNARVG